MSANPKGLKAVSDLLADLVSRHVAEQTRSMDDDRIAATERRDAWVELAAELLGRLDAVAPMTANELEALDEELSALPKDVQKRFAECREDSARAEKSGANARLRRAS